MHGEGPLMNTHFDQLDARTISQPSNANMVQRAQHVTDVNDTKMSDNEAFLAYTQSNNEDDD